MQKAGFHDTAQTLPEAEGVSGDLGYNWFLSKNSLKIGNYMVTK